MENKIPLGPFIFIGTVILGFSIISSSFLLSKTGFYIQNLGGGTSGDTPVNTISVSGNGEVYASPDIIKLDITAKEIEPTSKEAQTKVNERINAVIELLSGITKEEDIQTTYISLRPEYEWTEKGQQLKGQRAEQQLSIKFRDIEKKKDDITTLIDKLAEFDGIEIGSINYDIEDKTELYTQARELAFEKAEQKANELAKLGNVELSKPISIQDRESGGGYTNPMYRNSYLAVDGPTDGAQAELPTGQLQLRITVDVIYGIK